MNIFSESIKLKYNLVKIFWCFSLQYWCWIIEMSQPEPNVVGFLWVLRFPHMGRKICLNNVSTFMTICLALHAFIVDLQTRDSKQHILPELIICTCSFLFSCLNQSAGKNHCIDIHIQHKYNDMDIN